MNNAEQFNNGAEALRNVQIALDPTGRVTLDGYALILVDTDGNVHYTERSPSRGDVDGSYVKGLEALKKINWGREAKPNTPSVEMVIQRFFPEMRLKAYAMWANSSVGVCAQTFAVYSALNAAEQTKICDTIDTSIDLRNQGTTFTMR